MYQRINHQRAQNIAPLSHTRSLLICRMNIKKFIQDFVFDESKKNPDKDAFFSNFFSSRRKESSLTFQGTSETLEKLLRFPWKTQESKNTLSNAPIQRKRFLKNDPVIIRMVPNIRKSEECGGVVKYLVTRFSKLSIQFTLKAN